MDRNYYGITDIGKVRSNNEDTFIAQHLEGTNYILACVIDGVGGYEGGEVAAAIARKTIISLMDRPEGDLSLLMQAAFAEANDQILAAKQLNKDHEDMACVMTMALVDLKKNQFYYAHVGDTRLYLLRDDSLIKISKDQSFVGFMEDSGRLTEEQAMRHPKRNEINKALGFAGNIGVQEDYVETGHSPFLPGDLILLCSDGLSDMVNKQQTTDILLKFNDLGQKAEQLVKAANQNGGRDNITVVLVKNTNAAHVHEATKPLIKPKKKKLPLSPVSIPEQTLAQESPEQNTALVPTPVPSKSKKYRPWVISAVALLLIIFAVTRPTTVGVIGDNPPATPSPSPEYLRAIALQDTLDNLEGNILVLDSSWLNTPILLKEPIRISKDSLYLKATGRIILKNANGFHGEPFLIAPNNKSVLIENFNLEFHQLDVLKRKGILLKNVQMILADSIPEKSGE